MIMVVKEKRERLKVRSKARTDCRRGGKRRLLQPRLKVQSGQGFCRHLLSICYGLDIVLDVRRMQGKQSLRRINMEYWFISIIGEHQCGKYMINTMNRDYYGVSDSGPGKALVL